MNAGGGIETSARAVGVEIHAEIEFADLYIRDPGRRRRKQDDLVVTTGEPAREIPGERLDAARERRSDRGHVMA